VLAFAVGADFAVAEETRPRDDELAEAFDAVALTDPWLAESLLDDEGPSEDESAHAAPAPVTMATPAPRATASPPTRPIYREAPIASSSRADQYYLNETTLLHHGHLPPSRCPLDGRFESPQVQHVP
jgi:hypothetical protein